MEGHRVKSVAVRDFAPIEVKLGIDAFILTTLIIFYQK